MPTHTAILTPTGVATEPATSTSSATLTPIASNTITALSTSSPVVPTATSGPCINNFPDVLPGDTFYDFIRCLACRNIVSGYTDGTFKPGNDVTRGQLAKIVSGAAGFDEDPGMQLYQDVPPGSTFYLYINRLAMRGHISGYVCGSIGEECVPPMNLPYFRPGQNATRGQVSKIVSNSAGFNEPAGEQVYADVTQGNPFYEWIMRLTSRGVMSGYQCGRTGEPCDGQFRPYFRPGNNVTRGQVSKIVANSFFPGCNPVQPR